MVYDNKKMHCLSPKIDIPVAWRNPDNPEPIPLDYGFIMDDVKRVQVILQSFLDLRFVIKLASRDLKF